MHIFPDKISNLLSLCKTLCMLQSSQIPSTITEGYEPSNDERSDEVVENYESDEVSNYNYRFTYIII